MVTLHKEQLIDMFGIAIGAASMLFESEGMREIEKKTFQAFYLNLEISSFLFEIEVHNG